MRTIDDLRPLPPELARDRHAVERHARDLRSEAAWALIGQAARWLQRVQRVLRMRAGATKRSPLRPV